MKKPKPWTCPVCRGGVAPGVERCPCRVLPFVSPPQPIIIPFVAPAPTAPAPTTNPWGPWTPPFTITWQQPCMIEEFFRANPNAGPAGIACPCPRCTPMFCATPTCSAENLQAGSDYAILSA